MYKTIFYKVKTPSEPHWRDKLAQYLAYNPAGRKAYVPEAQKFTKPGTQIVMALLERAFNSALGIPGDLW